MTEKGAGTFFVKRCWHLYKSSMENLYEDLLGKWVEITLADGKKWVGILEEVDEDAIYITNGNDFGTKDHKGAECTLDEAQTMVETALREFHVE